MKRMLPLLALLAVAACGSGGRTLHGYGMSIRLADGWHGRISHGLVVVRGGGAWIEVAEWQPSPLDTNVSYFRPLAGRPRLGVHAFAVHGRYFVVFARVPRTARTAARRVLASFRARRGSFYGGRLVPARFPARLGWHVGAGPAGRLLAQGGQTESWASTVPYRDPPNQLPPHRTLATLPRDGILIWLGLARDSRGVLQNQNSLRIDRRHLGGPFEGLPPRFGLYRAVRVTPRYGMDVWVFFGTTHPSAATVSRAQAELDAVRLPRWPRG